MLLPKTVFFAGFMVWVLFFNPAAKASWTQGPDMIYQRMDNALAVWEGYVYSFGGIGSSSSKVEKIQTNGGTAWIECQANNNLPFHLWRGTRSGDKYFIFSNPAAAVTRSVFIYDFYNNSWSTRLLPDSNPLVPDLWAPGVTTLNGYIWLAGGALTTGSGDQTALYRYDPANNIWTQKASMHRARNFFCLFSFDEKIWVTGGSGYGQSLNASEYYDPDADQWTEDEDEFAYCPVTVWGAADAVLDNRFWVIGGVQNESVTHQIWTYDPSLNNWSNSGTMILPRYRLDAISDNTTLYIAGGSPSQFTPTRDYQLYTLDNPTPTPIPSRTSTPTPTIPGQSSATPTPTSNPNFSPTPTQPPTQTFTPNPDCDTMGVLLDLSAEFFTPGTTFHLSADICNSGVLLKQIPLFVILEVTGLYYFYPSWSESLAYQSFDLRSGLTSVDVIPQFVWPDVNVAMSGLKFYGAITDFGITQILGDFSIVTFGFGPETGPTPTNTPRITATPTSIPGYPTATPVPPTPTSGPMLQIFAGDDAGDIPGAGCQSAEVFCFELTMAGASSQIRGVARVKNIGSIQIHVDCTPESGDWDAFTLQTYAFDLNPGEEQSIYAQFNPLAIKDYSSTLRISGPDASFFMIILKGRSIPP